ncbi:MAG TPA: hypothetical protein P5077_02840 [bacterium]|nr:hypothetical protein [bacterium]
MVDHLIAALSFIGLILSLIVHLLSVFSVDVSQFFPSAWLLHLGAFVVFAPLVFYAKKDSNGNSLIFPHAPEWVKTASISLFTYVVFNFLYFAISMEGSPSIEEGKYILHDHGRLIRELTAEEYHRFVAKELRGFSGHWLIFYFAPFAYFTFRSKK